MAEFSELIAKYKAAFYGKDARGMVLYVPNINEWFAKSSLTVSESKVTLFGTGHMFDVGHFDNEELPIRLKAALAATGLINNEFEVFLNRSTNIIEYNFRNAAEAKNAAAFLNDLQNYVKQGFGIKPELNLIITGSVAAVRTGQLAQNLKAQGFNIGYNVTGAARQFVEDKGKYRLSERQLAEINNTGLFSNAQTTLVAPASASYLSRMASGQIKFSGKVFVAPAMNFMMWQHPATQANVKKLIEQGVIFLGPVPGPMACRDFGFGRFAEPNEIAAAIKNEHHLLRNNINEALFDNPKINTAVKADAKKVLLVVQENRSDNAEVIKHLQSQGYEVKCVAAPEVDISNFGVETCKEHYELNTTPPGMEHIRLPEWADILLIHPANEYYLSEMVAGGASSFIGSIYLASKAPVFLVSDKPQPKLAKHGVRILENYKQLGEEIQMAAQELAGKHYLVLAGTPWERVDPFRFYANTRRPENHGAEVAAKLAALGARVTVITPFHSFSKPNGAITSVEGKNIESAIDILNAAKKLEAKFDGILQLANISQMRCPAPATKKHKKNGPDADKLYQVVGNIDVVSELRTQFPEVPLIGYNNNQQRVGVNSSSLTGHVVNACVTHEKKQQKVDNLAKINYATSQEGKKRAVVTTSRTEELLTDDGVIITNAFSGRQGQAFAQAFANKGWDVTLISGPTEIPDLSHPNISNIYVTTMSQMLAAAQREIVKPTDAYVSVAAIADFSMETPLDIRLAPGEAYRIDFKMNPSIVGTVAKSGNRPTIVVSFAAQSPEDILTYAQEKFKVLGVDMTIANPIGDETAAAKDPTQNQVYRITAAGVEELPVMPKTEVGRIIVDDIIAMQAAKKAQPAVGAA